MTKQGGNRLSNNLSTVYYLLITCLFYPAVLGSIFYTLLEGCYKPDLNLQGFLCISILVGILLCFCIDFLYTWVSKKYYSGKLFLSDIFILLLIVLAYRNLMDGVVKNLRVDIFFICFFLMHMIFSIWDFLLIPRLESSIKIKVFDIFGLLLSFLGYMKFYDNPLLGVISLWILTIGAVLTVGIESLKKINYEKE